MLGETACVGIAEQLRDGRWVIGNYKSLESFAKEIEERWDAEDIMVTDTEVFRRPVAHFGGNRGTPEVAILEVHVVLVEAVGIRSMPDCVWRKS